MNLTHLHFVKTVAELKSFSRAAEKCHITQSSLSNAVSQFEEQMGGRIFSRTTRKVAVTPFGERVLPLVEDVLQSANELTKAAREQMDPAHKLIRIGLTPLLEARIVAAVVDGFKRRHPAVNLIFKECHTGDLQNRLEAGTLDFAFAPATGASKNLGREFFYDEELFFVPSQRPLQQRARNQPISIAGLSHETFALTAGCGLADATRQLFHRNRIKLREYPGQALSYKVLEDWADLGVAAAILPQSKVHTSSALPLVENGDPITVGYEMTWNRKAQMPKHVREFLAYFRATSKKLVAGLAHQIQ